jgi:cytochrome c peroxidase
MLIKKNQWTALWLAAAAVLAGCGGGGGGGEATAPVTSEPAAAIASARASGTTSTSAAAAVLDFDPASPPPDTMQLPAHFEAALPQDNTPAGTGSKPALAALGRVLFHDRKMSVNDTLSCASCHKQEGGFGDSTRFSLGFAGTARTTAHAMRLANVRFFQPGSMFWDRRSASLESQSTLPLQHPVEMGFDASNGGMPALIAKVQGLAYYPELFAMAFGDGAVTEARMQQALAHYMRGIVSVNSRWDEGYAQVFDATLPDKGLSKPLPNFTEQENRGRHLFMALPPQGGRACAVCHVPPSFALSASAGGTGLDAGESTKFKAPSLKNVALSGAFMHDGRFSTLEEVVEHYNSGVQDGPALDARLKGADGLPRKLNMTAEDKAAMVAFLKTLSDPVLAKDPRFASPFRQ